MLDIYICHFCFLCFEIYNLSCKTNSAVFALGSCKSLQFVHRKFHNNDKYNSERLIEHVVEVNFQHNSRNVK